MQPTFATTKKRFLGIFLAWPPVFSFWPKNGRRMKQMSNPPYSRGFWSPFLDSVLLAKVPFFKRLEMGLRVPKSKNGLQKHLKTLLKMVE